MELKTEKPAETSSSPPAYGGIEEWLKRVTIVLAFLYVNGYVAFRSYCLTLGLTPADFGMTEKDYFIQGISFLIFDPRTLALGASKSPSQYWNYYLIVFATWVIFIMAFVVTFTQWSSSKKRVLGVSALLGCALVFLNLVAAHHGIYRAQLTAGYFDSLPLVAVSYESPEPETKVNVLYGQLLVRTSKMICVANPTLHIIGTNTVDMSDQTGLEFIPCEKIVKIVFTPPAALQQQLKEKSL